MSRNRYIQRLSDLPRRIMSRGLYLVREPARFVENLEDAIRPQKYRKKLLGFQPMPPMQVRIDGDSASPHCNVLLPLLDRRFTGGPNTVVNIASHLAEAGIPVRLLATDGPVPADAEALRRHIASVAGLGQAWPNISFGSTATSYEPVESARAMCSWRPIGRPRSPKAGSATHAGPTVYLPDSDFEPAFYPWSSSYAQALEHMACNRALINNSCWRIIWGPQPAVSPNPTSSRPARYLSPRWTGAVSSGPKAGSRRQLLFYARPNDLRDLFGIGFEAFSAAVSHPLFQDTDWRFFAIGANHLMGR